VLVKLRPLHWPESDWLVALRCLYSEQVVLVFLQGEMAFPSFYLLWEQLFLRSCLPLCGRWNICAFLSFWLRGLSTCFSSLFLSPKICLVSLSSSILFHDLKPVRIISLEFQRCTSQLYGAVQWLTDQMGNHYGIR